MNERYAHLIRYIDLDRKLIEIERSKRTLKDTYVSKGTSKISDRLQRVK